MSVSKSHQFENQIEVLKFQDSHLVLRILDFLVQKEGDKSQAGNLLQYKKKVLFKTFLFDNQKQFLQSHSDLSSEAESEAIEKAQESLKKKEDLSKLSIIGFLNLMDNYRKNSNFDMNSSISKKIVMIIYLL
jgi:hypothetical protein